MDDKSKRMYLRLKECFWTCQYEKIQTHTPFDNVIRRLIVVFEGRNMSKSNISKLSNLESLTIRNYIKRRTLYKILRYYHTGEFQMFALNGFFALFENKIFVTLLWKLVEYQRFWRNPGWERLTYNVAITVNILAWI